ncbi:MAG: response regulator [Desulfobacteraceae bacterium]|nr:response regulator [Desulfobacteraceae bacterium]
MPKRKSYSIFIVDADRQGCESFRPLLAGYSHFVSYCTTVTEAKAIMAGITADMVLCRLTDPCLAIYDLLAHIQHTNPHCIRLVYQEPGRAAGLMKAVSSGFAHRFFYSPCAPQQVRRIIESSLDLRSRLDVQECWKFLDKSSHIPGLPPVVREVEEVLAHPDYEVNDLAAVLEKDPIIASRLLQIVNSAAFFKTATVSSLRHALVFLGAGLVREIMLYICAMEVFPQPAECRYKAVKVAMHSLQCAKLARIVAREVSPGLEEEAGAAALLHDIGKLVYFSFLCPRYVEFIAMRGAFDLASTEVEEEVFGIPHTKLGGSLLLWWNMPLALVETAANHNLPLVELEGIPKSVAIADRCLLEAARGEEVTTDLRELPRGYPLATWREIARKLMNTLR